jgi:hypothetical protein
MPDGETAREKKNENGPRKESKRGETSRRGEHGRAQIERKANVHMTRVGWWCECCTSSRIVGGSLIDGVKSSRNVVQKENNERKKRDEKWKEKRQNNRKMKKERKKAETATRTEAEVRKHSLNTALPTLVIPNTAPTHPAHAHRVAIFVIFILQFIAFAEPAFSTSDEGARGRHPP